MTRGSRSLKTSLALLSTCAVVAFGTAGCGDAVTRLEQQSKQWQERASDLQKQLDQADETFRKESEEWRRQTDQLGNHMVVAADQIHPLVIKELFRDNKTLGQLNEQLKATLEAASTTKDKRVVGNLRIKLHDYRGSGVVRGYLDGTYKAIIIKDLQSPPSDLGVKFDLASAKYDDFKKTLKANSSGLDEIISKIPAKEQLVPILPHLMLFPEAKQSWRFDNQTIASAFVQSRSDIDKEYGQAVSKAFDSFLKKGMYLRPPEPDHLFLDRLSLAPGHHEIRFTVDNASADFAVSVNLEEVLPDGTALPARSFDIDPTTTRRFTEPQTWVFWITYSSGAGK